MIDVIATFMVLAYAIVALKVDEWSNLSALGLKIEVPGFYLRHSMTLSVFQIGLFTCSLVSIFGMTAMPWYVGVVILLIVWFSAGAIGRKKAFRRYRQIWKAMISSPGTEDEISTREKNSKRSDQELGEAVAKMFQIEAMRSKL